MEKEIIIERLPENAPRQKNKLIYKNKEGNVYYLDAPEVTEKRHALITIKDKEIFIRDMDSTNGVYVNGFRIKEAILNCRDKVVIAKKYPIDDIIVGLFKKNVDPNLDPNDYTKEFFELKKIYEDYQTNRKKCNNTHQMKINLLRIAVVTIPAVAFMMWAKGLKDEKGNPLFDYFPVYITLTAVLPIFMNFFNLENKKMIELDRKFKKRYKCPRCKLILSQDWEIHREEKICPRCKAIWSD